METQLDLVETAKERSGALALGSVLPEGNNAGWADIMVEAKMKNLASAQLYSMTEESKQMAA